MKNKDLQFVAELFAEGFITRLEFDRILSSKFKFSEILQELDMDGELYNSGPLFDNGIQIASNF